MLSPQDCKPKVSQVRALLVLPPLGLLSGGFPGLVSQSQSRLVSLGFLHASRPPQLPSPYAWRSTGGYHLQPPCPKERTQRTAAFLRQAWIRSSRSSPAAAGCFRRASNRPHLSCLAAHLLHPLVGSPLQRLLHTPSSACPTGLMLRCCTHHEEAPEQRLLQQFVIQILISWSTSSPRC